MNLWKSIDLSESLKTYEYTKYAKYQIYSTIESKDFKNMDSMTIFNFLSNKIEIVSFHEYLKRFLVQRAGDELSEKEFAEIMRNSFVENAAPYSLSETKQRLNSVIRGWLKADSVKREVIFLIGFGLNMEDVEVEEFLTKVNKEESFDFGNPSETIFWYCFHNGLKYSKARELLNYYDKLESTAYENKSLWEAMKHDPKMYVHSEKELKIYLKYLKTFLHTEDKVFDEFINLYERVCSLIHTIYADSAMIDGEESSGKVNPSVIENVFYAEIPKKGNNLEKMSASMLARQFQNKRMSRQYLSRLLRKKEKPDRFDLITLLFFLYAQNEFYESTEEDKSARFMDFMDEINSILLKCNMAGIYPVNPYEAFILMCLVTDDPLGSFYDVWGYSYGKQEVKVSN